MFQSIEQLVVDRLSSSLSDVAVYLSPDLPSDFSYPKVPRQVYVRTGRLRLERNFGATSLPFVQPGELQFEVRVLGRSLRDDLYPVSTACLSSLSGWLPTRSLANFSFTGPFRLIEWDYVSRSKQSQLWDYGMLLVLPLLFKEMGL